MLRIGVIMYQTSLTKGQELVAQRMVREFRRQGYDAFLITSIYNDWSPVVSADDVKRRGGYISLFDESLGIPVVRVSSENASWPPRRISFSDFVGNLASIVEDLKLNVLITHSTLWNGPEETVKFVEWRRNLARDGAARRPPIFCHMSHLQEPSDERYAIYERSYREAWNRTILPHIMAEANLILVTTPHEAAFMKRLGVSEEKLALFPGGFDYDALEYLGRSRELRARHALPGHARLVAFLGTVEERKNVLAVLEVAKLLSDRVDVHFVIAGALEGEYGDRVKEEAPRFRNVSLLGPISEEEKAELIKATYLNITMSRAEALGISQLEFMSAGVPVITSGVGGQSWVVKNGATGVVLSGPDDVKGAAASIRTLAGRPTLRNEMGKKAARFASEFSITRLVQQLSKRLEDALQRPLDGLTFMEGVQAEERIIDVWTRKGRRVAATSKRLFVGSLKSGREVVSIPYSEISKIARHSKAHWSVIGTGAFITLLLIVLRVMKMGIVSYLKPGLQSLLSALGLPGLTQALVDALPFLPLIVAVLAFLVTIQEGYLVYYGVSKRAFLPEYFLKALKLADRLTPNDLFAEGG